MPSFQYDCLNRYGKQVIGQISSESSSQAVDKLRSMGLTIIDLKETKPKLANSFFSLGRKVSIGDVTLFSRQLAAMIAAGIPVTNAINILSRQASNPKLKSALTDISVNLDSGMSLTDAFSVHSDIFSDLYIAMLHAGEVGGILENTLLRLSEQLQKEKVLKDEVKTATSYPKLISIFAIIMFFAMMVFLVPVFRGFITSQMEMPGISRFIFNVSDSIRNYWYLWILVIGAIIAEGMLFFRSKTGRSLWERQKLTLPIFGPIILKSVIARFTRTLATLLEGGIPVVQALESAGPTSGSDLVADTVKLACSRIAEGKSISSTFEESGIFPPMVTHMIAVGEESGSLPVLLDKVAEFYEQEVSTETRGLQALIQPIALIMIGALIGGMLIALYLPIFTSIMSSGGGLG